MIFLRRWRAPSARIVRLGIPEADIIAELHATGFARGWSGHEVEGLLVAPGVAALGARLGTAVLGMVLIRAAADEAEILSIAVMPEWRGCGLAGRLLGHALDHVAARGGRRIFLEVEAGNGPALALYRRAGFVEVGRRRGYYAAEGGGDALVLSRDLADRAVWFPPPPDAVEIGSEPR
jgi:[ribosomal protein S18]-alanine N-acetyltransferase